MMYTTPYGLTISLIYASSQERITGPYDRVMDICTGVHASIAVLLTAFFWWFKHTSFASPLVHMTELLLLSSVQRDQHPLYHPATHSGIHLTEVCDLANAHDGNM